MHGESKIKDLLRRALKASPADQTEAVIQTEDSYLTRFANSAIHQNVAERNATLTVRAVFGKRIGSAATNILTGAELMRTVRQACEMAKAQRDNPDFVSLPGPTEVTHKAPALYVPHTADYSPKARAEAVKIVCDLAAKHGSRAFGAFTTGAIEVGVANSLGVMRYATATHADINAIVMTDTGSGFAQSASRDAAQLDFRRIAARAVKKAVDSQRPAPLAPGRYTVVLEHAAVDEMIGFLNGGFSALSVQEGRSFLCGRFGKQVVSKKISISDDAFDPRGFAFPFDFEGVPKQRVALIKNGVAAGVVHNSFTAHKEQKRSTGHGFPEYGNAPSAANLVMKGGDSSIAKMIASTKRGVYVTRFNYCNIIDPMTVEITGMTRDGTFLIEDGRIAGPVRNFRFTESVVAALSRVTAVSKDVALVSQSGGYGRRFAMGSLVPALKIERFNFTGATEY